MDRYKQFHRKVSETDIRGFIDKVMLKMPPSQAVAMGYIFGKKNIKITKAMGPGHESCWGFVEIATGDLLKAADWSTPAKHARGNIFDPEVTKDFEWIGPRYLR